MHGFIYTELKRFVEEAHGRKVWIEMLEKADLGEQEYRNFMEYPDEHAQRLVGVASEMTGDSPGAVLEAYGTFLGRDLFNIYRPIIDPEWRTVDFLANVEETIHEVVRMRNRHAGPPGIQCEKVAEDQALIHYRSSRRLCALARGLIRGVAGHYRESVELSEEACMLRGDSECLIRVRVTGSDGDGSTGGASPESAS